jgi:anti-anti-sigma factor
VIQTLEINSRLLWKELYVMERHLTTSTISIRTRNENGMASPLAANRSRAVFGGGVRAQPAGNEPGSALTSVSHRVHTLILTGELTHRSAHALEVEIERLCEEEVTSITLDLRQLTAIDSIGAAVIAFRCGLCQRQGYGFTLIPGSRSIQRAFEQAGMISLLPFQDDEVMARRLRVVAPVQRSRDGCEQ